MQRVFRSRSLTEAQLVRSSLEMDGIGSFVKNENVACSLGTDIAGAVTPEVWIYDDRDLERATAIVATAEGDFRRAAARRPIYTPAQREWWTASRIVYLCMALVAIAALAVVA